MRRDAGSGAGGTSTLMRLNSPAFLSRLIAVRELYAHLMRCGRGRGRGRHQSEGHVTCGAFTLIGREWALRSSSIVVQSKISTDT